MRPIMVLGLLLFPTVSEPVAVEDAPCMAKFARRSRMQADRDGTQDLFCD